MTGQNCYRVLTAHADDAQGRRLAAAFQARGVEVVSARSGRECLQQLDQQTFGGVAMDRDLGDLGAGEILEHGRRRFPQLAVIVVSDQANTQEAVRLTKIGLDDYLPLSLPADQIADRLIEILACRQHPAAPAPSGDVRSPLIGASRAIQEVIGTIHLIAAKRSTVLITGPTGTGKEVAAKLIHSLSPRRNAAMVAVNCGAIPDNLLEAEFFGHVKGAFTGAIAQRMGRFEQAHGSTLFLDEIGELSFELQAKVLRAVQEREFQRVGSSQTVQVDVRVIAAANCDLAEKVRRGEFREDLYYRLNVVPIVMPALADHLEDLPALVDHVLSRVCLQENLPEKRISSTTLERLMQYNWPGNVRQLENAVEKAVVLSGDRGELYPSDFPLPAPEPRASLSSVPDLKLPPGGLDLDALIGRLERSLLEQALERSAGNKKRAADMLRLKRTTLSAKLRALPPLA